MPRLTLIVAPHPGHFILRIGSSLKYMSFTS